MAYLCWVGWLEVHGLIVSVNVVYGNSPICRGPMDGDVKEVYLVVCLAFRCELESRVYCI